MAITYPLAWPIYQDGRLMVPTDMALDCKGASASGGQTADGPEQVVVSPQERWEALLTLGSLRAADVVLWRGFVAAMRGRLGSVLLPAFEFGRQPWPVDAYGRLITPGWARDPRLRGTAYAVDAAKDAQANINVTAAAAAVNAVNLVLHVTQGGVLRPGHRFSLGTHLHEIRDATLVAPGIYNVIVRPWLREAISAGTTCEFRAPVCQMRFKTDAEGALTFKGVVAQPQVALVELF